MSKRFVPKYVDIEAESESESSFSSDIVSEQLSQSDSLSASEIRENYKKMFQKGRFPLVEEKCIVEDEEDEDEDYYDKVAEAPPQSALLPTPESPFLFLIRCKIGFEKTLASKISEKSRINKLEDITAVIYKEGLKGHLYVESFKKVQIEEALYGIRGTSHSRISIVPFSEMPEALSYNNNYIVGEFGRIKSGKYKNDLVQILESYIDSCLIKAIPRLEDNIKKKFDPEEYRSMCFMKDNGYYYNRDFYKDGFLHKVMMKKSLEFNVEPTFSELEELNQVRKLDIDDQVIVKSGDYRNLKGHVKSINNGVAVIEDNGRLIEVEENSLEKYFEVGNTVSYNNSNGILLNIENGTAVVGMNELTEEIVIPVAELGKPIMERNLSNPKKVGVIKARKDTLLNQTVKIKKGRYKGINGVVKEAFNGMYKIQLLGDFKSINVHRNDISRLGDEKIQHPYNMLEQQNTDYVNKKNESSISARNSVGGGALASKTPKYRTPGYSTPGAFTPSMKSVNTFRQYQMNNTIKKNVSPYHNATVKYGDQVVIIKEILGDLVSTIDGKSLNICEISTIRPSPFASAVVVFGEHKGTKGTFIKSRIEHDKEIGQIKTTEGSTFWTDLSDITVLK